MVAFLVGWLLAFIVCFKKSSSNHGSLKLLLRVCRTKPTSAKCPLTSETTELVFKQWQVQMLKSFPFINLLELISTFLNSEQFPALRKKCLLILNPL